MPRKKVEISESLLRKKIQDGRTDKEIAFEISVSVKTIRNKRKEYGVEAAYSGRPVGSKDSKKRKEGDRTSLKEALYLVPRSRPVDPNRGVRSEDLPKLATGAYKYEGNVAVLKSQFRGQAGLPNKVKVVRDERFIK